MYVSMLALSGESFSIPTCEDPVAEAFVCMRANALLPQKVIR